MMKDMLKHTAYMKLTNASRVTYLLLKLQVKHYEQAEVKFPVSHAEEYMEKHTFLRSIKQLIEFGFISKTSQGGLYRRTNIYKFIDDWRGASLDRPPYMVDSIRGGDMHTVKKVNNRSNKCLNHHHITPLKCLDGGDMNTVDSVEITT